ncbi:hypothetical protein OG21DRAFT_1488853 [Imleria badia]|nr:hypothetical protein OG21DRAFT_1488853 [Imleria badia]
MDTVTIDTSNFPMDFPAILGYALSTCLYGILVVQVFIYFTRFTKDSKRMKRFILLIFVLETLSLAALLFEMIQGAKIHCFSCLPLAWTSPWDISWSYRTLSILLGSITLLVHGFYCWRIYVLSGNWYIPVFVMLSSSLQSIVLGIGMLLLRRKKQMPIAETNSLIRKLIQLTIETGAVTPAAMALRMLLFNYDPTSDVVVSMSKQEIVVSKWPFPVSLAQLIVCYALTRLYANCLLASLNARLVISGDNSRMEVVSTVLFDRSELHSKEESVEISSV